MTGESDMAVKCKPRLSKLAVLAFVSSIQCLVVMGIVADVLPLRHTFVLPHLWLIDFIPRILFGTQASRSTGLRESLLVPGLTWLTVLPAMVLGFVGAIRIDRSYGRLKGVSLCMAAIGIAATCLFVASPLIPRDLGRAWEAVKLIRTESSEEQRKESLVVIGRALRRYADHHGGNYPDATGWCNTLLNEHYLRGQQRLLWLANKRRWCCAINPDCGPNSCGETVLLFESYPGWNRRGGFELFVRRHKTTRGRGGYVFYKNGGLKFVVADTAAQLVWE